MLLDARIFSVAGKPWGLPGVDLRARGAVMPRVRASPRRGASDAAAVLGQQIKVAWIARRWSARELAARIGVDRRTVAAIEAGDPAVSLGNALNAADILRVPLFGAENTAELARLRREGRERLALLPTRVDTPRRMAVPDDDF